MKLEGWIIGFLTTVSVFILLTFGFLVKIIYFPGNEYIVGGIYMGISLIIFFVIMAFAVRGFKTIS